MQGLVQGLVAVQVSAPEPAWALEWVMASEPARALARGQVPAAALAQRTSRDPARRGCPCFHRRRSARRAARARSIVRPSDAPRNGQDSDPRCCSVPWPASSFRHDGRWTMPRRCAGHHDSLHNVVLSETEARRVPGNRRAGGASSRALVAENEAESEAVSIRAHFQHAVAGAPWNLARSGGHPDGPVAPACAHHSRTRGVTRNSRSNFVSLVAVVRNSPPTTGIDDSTGMPERPVELRSVA